MTKSVPKLVSAFYPLTVLIAACGWLSPDVHQFAEVLSRTAPEQFFTDPLQVRLAEAVDRGDFVGIEVAVKAGADVNARGRDGCSLLYWAMARGRLEGFEELVRKGADVTAEYRDPDQLHHLHSRRTIILAALEARDLSYLRAVLRHGFDPNYVVSQSSGQSLLFAACSLETSTAAQMLLDGGAAINQQNMVGNTALASSIMQRDYRMAWFLLERGADPTVTDELGHDVSWRLREYGSRGVRPEQREYFEKVVDELVKRSLLTRQDIVEADKPKTPNSGITVIEHAPKSEAGQAILELDQLEREAAGRANR